MPITDEQAKCKWCDENLVRDHKRIYHDGVCADAAANFVKNVYQRHSQLGVLLGLPTRDQVKARIWAGCEGCKQQSVSLRGPAKSCPYPLYRVFLGFLLCPSCFRLAIRNPLHRLPGYLLKVFLEQPERLIQGNLNVRALGKIGLSPQKALETPVRWGPDRRTGETKSASSV